MAPDEIAGAIRAADTSVKLVVLNACPDNLELAGAREAKPGVKASNLNGSMANTGAR